MVWGASGSQTWSCMDEAGVELTPENFFKPAMRRKAKPEAAKAPLPSIRQAEGIAPRRGLFSFVMVPSAGLVDVQIAAARAKCPRTQRRIRRFLVGIRVVQMLTKVQQAMAG